MKRLTAAALTSVLLVGACEAGTDRPSSNGPQGRSGQTSGHRSEALKRAAEVYSAVIRQHMKHNRGFERIFVVDGPVRDADNLQVRGAERPFPPRLKKALIGKLDDLQPLRFISHPDQVRRGEAGRVVGDGVIVLLGEIERHGRRVHVPYTSWCGGLCAQSETYVLEARDRAWEVVGNTGQMIVS